MYSIRFLGWEKAKRWSKRMEDLANVPKTSVSSLGNVLKTHTHTHTHNSRTYVSFTHLPTCRVFNSVKRLPKCDKNGTARHGTARRRRRVRPKVAATRYVLPINSTYCTSIITSWLNMYSMFNDEMALIHKLTRVGEFIGR